MSDAKSIAGPRFDSLEQEVYLNLWRTYDRLKEIEDELFAEYALTAQQYNALRILKAERPATVPTLLLAERLISRAPDITRMLDRLEQRGLIDRVRPAENRRLVLVGITTAGKQLLRQLERPVRDCHQRQLGHMSAEAMKQLATLLRAARKPHERRATEG